MSQTGIFQEIAEMVGVGSQQQIVKYATPIHLFPTKNRLALIGTVGAGKSTVVGGLVMTAETLVAETTRTSQPFFCRVIEGSSEIHQDVSDLREGHFPSKTVPFGDFASEAGLLLEWEFNIDLPLVGSQTLRRKLLQVPICDIAGEDLQQTIRQVRKQGPLGEFAKQKVRNLIAYVRESDGYIITIKATRAKGFRNQLEEEADLKLSPDPDVNVVRLLEDLMNYKVLYRSRPIKGVAVVITACDIFMKKIGDELGIDLLDQNLGQHELERFVAACFPSTYAAIQSLRVPNVQYFPSFFEVETDEQSKVKNWTAGDPKIKRRRPDHEVGGDWWRNMRKISYSEKSYIDLIDWLKRFAMGM